MTENLYCFWLSENEMNPRRKDSLKNLSLIGLEVVLITNENLEDYLIEPIHSHYKYLSAVHKSDYLRCYFMHFYGGAYADIKTPTGSWRTSMNEIQKHESVWFIGFPPPAATAIIGLGPEYVAKYWPCDLADQGFLCQNDTSITKEWYSQLIKKMNLYGKELERNPAKLPHDRRDCHNHFAYPVTYFGLLNEILKPILLKYPENLRSTLPALLCEDYR